MFRDLKNSLKLAWIIIGTVIGAGFASGQEILQFFTVFNQKGMKGIFLTGVLFCLISLSVLHFVYKFKVKNYTEFITMLMGRYSGTVIDFIVMLFLLFNFIIMVAGAGAIFKEYFNVEPILGAGILSFAFYIVFLFNLKGIIILNSFIGPMLITGINFMVLYIYSFLAKPVSGESAERLINDWISASIIYVSYNSIILVAVLSTLLPLVTSKKVIYAGAILGGGTLCLTAFIIYKVTMIFYPAILKYQIPLLHIIREFNVSLNGLYLVILFMAIFVSGVNAGYCFLNKISRDSTLRFDLCGLIMCIAAVPLGLTGFSNLIKWIYPIFGYLGLFQVLIIVLNYIYEIIFGVVLYNRPS